MSLQNVQNLVVGMLSDGRLQAWANAGAPNEPMLAYSRWKTTPDPNAPWTDWTHLPEDDKVTYLLAVEFLTGRTQLIAYSGNPTLSWKFKATTDPSSTGFHGYHSSRSSLQILARITHRFSNL